MAKTGNNKLSLKEEILLSCKYTSGILFLGMAFNFFYILVFINELSEIEHWSESFFTDTLFLKALVILGGIYLQHISKNKDTCYFYINLGLSIKKMYAIAIILDSLFFIIIMIVTFMIWKNTL